jgi:hypothetical protein
MIIYFHIQSLEDIGAICDPTFGYSQSDFVFIIRSEKSISILRSGYGI